WPLLLLPLLLAALGGFAVGLALVVSVLHAYFRDVAPILAAVLLPWFFVSPIFFDPADITTKEAYRQALQWANPVAPFITGVRDGIVPLDSGRMESGGQVVALLELGAGFGRDFSGRENILLNGALYGLAREQIESRMDDIVAFSELGSFIDVPVKTYSSGMFV